VIYVRKISKRECVEIENRLYRYAEIDKTIAEIEQKINDAIPSQSTSIVLFGVTGGQLICSIQENFYSRKDIYGMVSKIMKLKEEKRVMDKIVCLLSVRETDILVYRYVMNRDYREICRAMKIKKSNYYNRLYLLLCRISYLMEKT